MSHVHTASAHSEHPPQWWALYHCHLTAAAEGLLHGAASLLACANSDVSGAADVLVVAAAAALTCYHKTAPTRPLII